MSSRLKSFPAIVCLCAAVDTLTTRAQFAHRSLDLALFGEALGLYAALALFAWIPARVFQRWTRWWSRTRDEREERASDAVSYLAWLAFPVVVHARLKIYTDIYADFTQLQAARPWIEIVSVIALFALIVRFVPRALSSVSLALVGWSVALASLVAGATISMHEELDPPSANAAHSNPARPNILVLIWDTTRARSLNVYGYDRDTTPNLARLASESIVFDQARSASRYTLTSHLSMLTGAYPSHHGARLLHQSIDPVATPSIAHQLREAGYRTGGFVGTGVLRAQTGTAFEFERWDDQVDPPVCDTFAWALIHDLQSIAARCFPALENGRNPHWIQDFQRPAGEVLAHASDWIHESDPRPWFCFVNLYDVHWPYVPANDAAEKWVEPYGGPLDGFFRYMRHPPRYSPNDVDKTHLRELYDAEMWQLDRNVDHFLAGLDLAKSNTAVVMCADHGEAFGEGERYEHADILECQVRIPLMIRLPDGKSKSTRIEAPVSGVDVAPTVLALGGAEIPKSMNGRDLLAPALDPNRPILVEDRDTGDPEEVRLGWYEGTWKFEQIGVGVKAKRVLYDLTKDENGLQDVAAEHPELVAKMAAAMEEMRKSWHANDDPSRVRGAIQNKAALEQLGYVGGEKQDASPDPKSAEERKHESTPETDAKEVPRGN